MTVLSQPFASVFKPGPFGVVLRVVSERTATVAGVAIVGCSLPAVRAPSDVRCHRMREKILRTSSYSSAARRHAGLHSSRYGQRGQGVNGGSVGVWVKQAGCCYSTVVVTQWPTDVKTVSKQRWKSGDVLYRLPEGIVKNVSWLNLRMVPYGVTTS